MKNKLKMTKVTKSQAAKDKLSRKPLKMAQRYTALRMKAARSMGRPLVASMD